MKRATTAAVGLALILMAARGAFAGETARPVETKLKIERVALFKNGAGYFSGSATLPEGAKTVSLVEIPVASLGTFWVSYPKELAVRGLTTSLEDTKEEQTVDQVAEVLAASVGRKAKIYLTAEQGPPVEGTILAVPQPTAVELPSPYVMGLRERGPEAYPVGAVVLVKTGGGVTAISPGSIARADIESDGIPAKLAVPVKKPRVRIALAREAHGEKVSLDFLARGITWSPSYLVDLSGPKTARLSAQALVVNEVADLDGVRLELVTGYPHLQFADVVSPIAMSEPLAGFLASLERGRSDRGDQSVVTQQVLRNRNERAFDENVTPVSEYSTAKEGASAEDLFLYPVDAFSLRRGETAYVPLFTAEVSYEHVYTWQIADFLDENERYGRQQESRDRPKAEEVWHACRLTNTMKMPWTTAPAEFVKERRITGQDTLYYTAAGSKTTVRINRAMNLLAEKVEVEVERARAAAKFYGATYDRVKVKGELSLKNALAEPANVEVTKELSGDVLEKSPEAKDTATAEGLKRANTRHRLVWEVKLSPGETRKLGYVYQVLVRE